MLAILDTTALMNDPYCVGAAWRVLAHAPAAWHVRVLVPEVVLIEATGGHRRRVDEARTALDVWGRKHAGPLGLRNVQQEAAGMLNKAAADYRSVLDETLAVLNVEIVPPPDTKHAALVERAASRRKPCNSNGDGYRDTLNWLSLISLASDHPDEELIWVSDNIKDFGTDDGDALHPDLIEELQEAGAEQRVSWVRTVPDLILKLAANNNIRDAADVDTIQRRLKINTFNEFIGNEVLSHCVGMKLDPRQCALPTVVIFASILASGGTNETSLTVRGTIGESGSAVEFSVQAETSIQVRYPAGTLDDTVLTASPVNGTESTGQIIKPLIYSGLLTLDRYDRPTGGELTRVFAMDDEPGFFQWALADIINGSGDARSYIANNLAGITLPTIPPGYFKNLLPKLPAETYVNLNLVPPGAFKNLLPMLPPGAFNLLPTLPPDDFKNLLSKFPENYFKDLHLANTLFATYAAGTQSEEDLDEPDNESPDDPNDKPPGEGAE